MTREPTVTLTVPAQMASGVINLIEAVREAQARKGCDRLNLEVEMQDGGVRNQYLVKCDRQRLK